jgi:hypothetical protein
MDEVVEFAKAVGATDLKAVFDYSEFHGLFRRRNYFLFGTDKFLIVKVSRSKIRPFYGLGKPFFDLFNRLTDKAGDYHFVALVSNKSGWVLSKSQILNQIAAGRLSYSDAQGQYKINNYNLKGDDSFSSIEGFLRKIGARSLSAY